MEKNIENDNNANVEDDSSSKKYCEKYCVDQAANLYFWRTPEDLRKLKEMTEQWLITQGQGFDGSNSTVRRVFLEKVQQKYPELTGPNQTSSSYRELCFKLLAMRAIRRNASKKLKILFKAWKEHKKLTCLKDAHLNLAGQQTIIATAIALNTDGKKEEIIELLAHEDDISAPNIHGVSAFGLALSSPNLRDLETLLTHSPKEQIEKQMNKIYDGSFCRIDENGRLFQHHLVGTPIMIACYLGQSSVVERLLNLNAIITTKIGGATALDYAINASSTKCLALLSASKQFDPTSTEAQITTLHAAQQNKPEHVRIMLLREVQANAIIKQAKKNNTWKQMGNRTQEILQAKAECEKSQASLFNSGIFIALALQVVKLLFDCFVLICSLLMTLVFCILATFIGFIRVVSGHSNLTLKKEKISQSTFGPFNFKVLSKKPKVEHVEADDGFSMIALGPVEGKEAGKMPECVMQACEYTAANVTQNTIKDGNPERKENPRCSQIT